MILLLIDSCTPQLNKNGRVFVNSIWMQREYTSRNNLNNQLFWNAHKKTGDKSVYYFCIISKRAIHKTTCISMLKESGDCQQKPWGKETKTRIIFLVHNWSVLLWHQQVCLCAERDTYALRGSPGSGHSSAECGALWTGLMWRYLAPRMHKTLTSHTLNLTGTVTEVSSLF